MDLDAAVVFDEAELAKAIHEEADAGPGGADHLCQSFLCDPRNQALQLTWLTKFGHQQENPRQSLFAGVEKLIDKIGLGSHAPGQQEFQEHFGERVLLVHHADHLFPFYAERTTEGSGSGSGQVQPTPARQRLLSNEFPGGEKRYGGLSPVVRNGSKFCAARPKIED